MKTFTRILALLVIVLGPGISSHGSSLVLMSPKEQVAAALAICRGTVVQVASFRDQRDNAIKTESLIQIDEALKGNFPPVLRLVHDGGTVGDTGVLDGFSPQLRAGERRLFFLQRRADGFLGAANGIAGALALSPTEGARDLSVLTVRALTAKVGIGADVRDQAVAWSGAIPQAPITAMDATGLIVDGGTQVPSRYLLPDRGEPIEYLVDAQALPAGLNLNQCLGAVTNAFAAWSAVTGITFKYGGLQNFGQAAATVAIADQRIRVQLHDLFNFILSTSTLGQGGRSYAISGSFPNGGMGGRVVDQEFYPNNYGYVVLNHRATSMQTLLTFEEVLCHEIGHVLGMAHSSVNQNETDPTLREAIMFYLAHADSRGATLGAYDPPVIRKAHPPANTPPYGYDRVMDVVTASPQPNVAGINSVQISAFDRQNDALTLAMSGQAVPANGSFSLQGSLLRYTAAQPWSDSGRDDPAGNSFNDSVFVRLSDGVNASPYLRVRVLSFNRDTQPATSDGLPNWWMQQYFFSATPSAGTLSRAQDDKDGDGLTNLEEWLAGTNPTVASSRIEISAFNGSTLDFPARPYDLYEVVSSADFNTWTRAVNPVLPKTTSGSATGLGSATGSKFFQLRRVP